MLGGIVGTVKSRFVRCQKRGKHCMCGCGQHLGGGLGGKYGFYIGGGCIGVVVLLGLGWLEAGHRCVAMQFVEA